jgi:hypothetical protein
LWGRDASLPVTSNAIEAFAGVAELLEKQEFGLSSASDDTRDDGCDAC